MATTAIDSTRQRLNTLILLLPGQWFAAMVLFWARFPPPLRPFGFVVPAPAPLYPRLGLRIFRYLATDGEWINRRLRRIDPAYKVVRDRRARETYVAGTIANERWHLAFAIAGGATCGFALATRQIGWAIVIGLLNLVFNVYPVLHQRYTRARLRAPR
jgi:hypothetical protein